MAGMEAERQAGESWLAWATRTLRATLEELAMDVSAWEATFKTQHPGPGYTTTLQVQVARFRDDIDQEVQRTLTDAERAAIYAKVEGLRQRLGSEMDLDGFLDVAMWMAPELVQAGVAGSDDDGSLAHVVSTAVGEPVTIQTLNVCGSVVNGTCANREKVLRIYFYFWFPLERQCVLVGAEWAKSVTVPARGGSDADN